MKLQCIYIFFIESKRVNIKIFFARGQGKEKHAEENSTSCLKLYNLVYN